MASGFSTLINGTIVNIDTAPLESFWSVASVERTAFVLVLLGAAICVVSAFKAGFRAFGLFALPMGVIFAWRVPKIPIPTGQAFTLLNDPRAIDPSLWIRLAFGLAMASVVTTAILVTPKMQNWIAVPLIGLVPSVLGGVRAYQVLAQVGPLNEWIRAVNQAEELPGFVFEDRERKAPIHVGHVHHAAVTVTVFGSVGGWLTRPAMFDPNLLPRWTVIDLGESGRHPVLGEPLTFTLHDDKPGVHTTTVGLREGPITVTTQLDYEIIADEGLSFLPLDVGRTWAYQHSAIEMHALQGTNAQSIEDLHAAFVSTPSKNSAGPGKSDLTARFSVESQHEENGLDVRVVRVEHEGQEPQRLNWVQADRQIMQLKDDKLVDSGVSSDTSNANSHGLISCQFEALQEGTCLCAVPSATEPGGILACHDSHQGKKDSRLIMGLVTVGISELFYEGSNADDYTKLVEQDGKLVEVSFGGSKGSSTRTRPKKSH
jgi:hypothetical protein